MAGIFSRIWNWIKSKFSKGGKIVLELFKSIGANNGDKTYIYNSPEPAVIDTRSVRQQAEDWLNERGYSFSLESKPHSPEITKDFLEWVDFNSNNSKQLPENRRMAAKLKELENKYKSKKRRK